MTFKKLELDGAYEIEYFFAGDDRGGFGKIFEIQQYQLGGVTFALSESFFSYSQKNVIRGLHFQLKNPQAKIVSVLNGRVWDVLVDIRKDSDTFGRWTSVELSRDNHKAVYVPRGFAHGFASMEDNTIMLYQCDGQYDKETDTGIRYDDKEIGIEWPIELSASIHSQRDLGLMSFEEYKRIVK